MEYVIGLVFLLTASGDLAEAPGVFAFETMSECQAAREALKQYATENTVGVLVEMACIAPEAFQ